MIKRDYHGHTLSEALDDVRDIIDTVRLSNIEEADAEFIVGHGVIRKGLMHLLSQHGLKPKAQLGNDGVIVCVIQ